MKGCHARNVSKMKNSNVDLTIFECCMIHCLLPLILHFVKLSFSNALGNIQSYVKFGCQ